LLIPGKLYGREREIDALLTAFDRVLAPGAPELVLVSGYSGVGKSSVVNELHKALVPPHGLFASGKFDQYKRDIPYATLAQAFQILVRQILVKSEAEVDQWRHALTEAAGPNGQIIVNLVPEAELIIGKQPPVAELPPQQAQRRFQLVFRRFIGVFARPEHPLVLFLDDLQWLDAATLDLLEDLLTQPDVHHLLLIGAYRDNEVSPAHPLVRRLAAIRSAGARLQEIVLAPLGLDDVGQLIADALHCAPSRAAPLARLVQEKTAGNPFFAIQFLTALAEEGLLAFDHGKAGWSWNLDHIQAKGFTDNVVELMVGKLGRLPVEVQKALQWLACLGNSAEATTLSLVHGTSEERVHADMWEAVCAGLVERQGGSYKFIHDRVQEAAYSLVPERLRAEAHLRIGRLLAAHTPAEKREEAIFEIVNQLNRGAALITSRDEREQLAELNLIAGKRAKTSTAYASALDYLTAGAALLPESAWERRHELIFALELRRAECEFLTGELAGAEERLTALSARAVNTVERATVACLRVDLYTTLDQSGRAVAVGLDYLQQLGIEWSPHPTEEAARREYERIWSQLGGRAIEDLIHLPVMTDPASLATMDVLTKLGAPAGFTDGTLYFLVLSRAVNLSLERGNTDGSCFAYEWLGAVVGARFGDYNSGFRFAQLGYELVEQRGLRRFQARTYLNFGNLVLWTRPIRAGRDLLRRAFDAANKIGDLTDAAYACYLMIANLLAAGDPLVDVQREAEHARAFAEKMGFGLVIDITATQLALVRTLRGLTQKFGSFDDEHFDELRVELRFSSNPDLARAEGWYWIRKAQARFFAGDYAAAVDASLKAQRLLWAAPSNFEIAEHSFYGALSLAAVCDTAATGERQQYVAALAVHKRQLDVWAENCPENFENRAALVGAEIARIEGRTLEAMDLYERAIRSARANGFVHNEALAYEIAARFYLARGFETFGHAYLRNARNCYDSWGALGKVRQLDQRYPRLREESVSSAPTATIGAPVEQLDVGTMVKAAQAVSGEIVLGKLIETLMTIAVEHAGAERGLLILLRGDEPRIEAEATTGRGRVEVTQRQAAVTQSALPESVLHYVIRTRESVTLDDAAASPVFSADTYVQQRRPRSVLCFPLVKQAKLVGALYLENNLTRGAFTSDRIAVLELLASQAAISLENARLYRDLEQREAKIRRLVDANIIGIYLWEIEGRIIEANDTFLRMVGYDREDLVSGRVRWTDLTPPEWRDRSARNVEEVKMTGSLQPHEKELFRKDGSRVPVLLGSAAFDEQRDQGVTFVLDLTERKRGEEALRNAQADLTRVARLTTMGELAASIAHEINQPLGAMVANGDACLLWLANDTPNLDEARQAVKRIVGEGQRAGDIIRSVRALAGKSGPEMTQLDINDAIREVLILMRSELHRHDVSLETALSGGLEPIMGDRVQLQQVILNLIMNGIEAMSAAMRQPRMLRVRSQMDGLGNLLIAVEDSGPGLAPEAMDRLFEPFFTTKSSGMGMGLSICRSIVDAHGGRLWASPQLPRGAVFQFTVPTAAKKGVLTEAPP
jgi:PAS domain S-box-containing protein